MKKALPNPPDFLTRCELPFLPPKLGGKKGPLLLKKKDNYLKYIRKLLAWNVLIKR